MRRAQYILVDCGIMPSGSATGIKREQFVGFAQLNTDSIIRSYDLNDLRIEKNGMEPSSKCAGSILRTQPICLLDYPTIPGYPHYLYQSRYL
jgi:hypothetical protein